MPNESPKITKCVKCRRKVGKAKRIVKTEEETKVFDKAIRRTMAVGDILCIRCYKTYRNKFIIINKENKEKDDKEKLAELSDSSSSTSDSVTDDPDFIYKPKKLAKLEDADNKSTEVSIQRTLATHRYCFLCKSSTNLVSVPLTARKQVYDERKIFIPKNNRCCKNHLTNGCFSKSDLELIRIQSNNLEVNEDEIAQFLKVTEGENELKETETATAE